jgi:uncharacterized repeat protein (TIGR01451 family)
MNVVSVSATADDLDTSNNNATVTTIVQSDATPDADLDVSIIDDSDPIEAGTPKVVTYTIEVTNNGLDVATGVNLNFTLPTEMGFGMPVRTAGPAAACGATICSLEEPLDIGASATFTIVGTPNATGSPLVATIEATATADQDDLLTVGNETGSETTLIVPNGTLVFEVDAIGDGVDATPGDAICADAGGDCTLRAAI